MNLRRIPRSSIVLLMFGLVVVMLVLVGVHFNTQPQKVSISTLLHDTKTDITHHQVDTLQVQQDSLLLVRAHGHAETAKTWPGFSPDQALHDNGIDYANPHVLVVTDGSNSALGTISGLIMPLMTFAFLGILLFILMRQMQGGSSAANSFGKSRARMFTGSKQATTFNDVAGVEEAKQELQEIVEFLKYPDKFAALGARIPKGVLLVGPPGTGKTLISRAVAGEAGVPFFSISGSEFVEMFVGVGASRVRDLFEQAKKAAPCIIFVDEIDAVGRHRGAGVGGSHDEREQTLNQMLVEMDGFDSQTNVIVMAATNRPDVLDPALLRPGRFDRQVILDKPDSRGRLEILQVHARNKPLAKELTLERLAKATPGFSGADLQNLLNEAAILAAREGKSEISETELEEAIDRVIAGPQRKSRVITEHEKAVTAYHEVGHALVAHVLPNVDRVHKVSIVARGQMGGYTRIGGGDDRFLWSKSQFEDFLAFALGGHVAEYLTFGEVTTGASNDIQRVTSMARKMVTEYGMSTRLGPIALGHKEQEVFLGRDLGEQRNYSEQTAREIDEEVREIVQRALRRAHEVLTQHRQRLVLMSERLIAQEVLDGPEFEQLFTMPLPEDFAAAGREATNETLAALALPSEAEIDAQVNHKTN